MNIPQMPVLPAVLAALFVALPVQIPSAMAADAPAMQAKSEVMPPISATVGKSTILRLPSPVSRVSVGNPAVADVTLLNPREIYLLGKGIGSTNMIVWYKSGGTAVTDINVNVGMPALEARLRELLPGEKDIHASSAGDSIVLQGSVSDALKVDQAIEIAEAYVRRFSAAGTSGAAGRTASSSGRNIINMLKVRAPQQVMLEVKVAEVSRSLLDSLGAEFNMSSASGGWTAGILSSFLTGSGGVLSGSRGALKSLEIDAEKQDGIIKILAEPNIMAISGQTGKFLAGGRIFIPVPQSSSGIGGGTTITLEEREFGVRLAFTPTVLDCEQSMTAPNCRINLKVAPEVSELSATGTTVATTTSSNGNDITSSSVLPSFTVRNAETTVQLKDGQSFAIAGLIRNNVTETVKRFPVLGEIPILGALFRSSEFQNDRTELLFVVTPRLVKPLPPNYALPTDHYHEPDRAGYFLEGKMEGAPPANDAPAASAKPAGGFEMR